jgi:type IV secretion system protein VirB10
MQLQPAPPRVVFDNRATAPAPQLPTARGDGGSARVTAERFGNPSLTIPQGTVIPAVLETALDSTRAGGVRALVQRDVSGFDGSRVLIPRGSRLYGEYEATLQPGQNRALVRWTRLIRPDGVTIALDSPSSDPLGRVGIRGKVDTKFLQRFGGALLQSVLDIGVGITVNRATDGVILALPGSTQNVRIADPETIQPTLKVKHGTSVSVFVARDLDFSTVDR